MFAVQPQGQELHPQHPHKRIPIPQVDPSARPASSLRQALGSVRERQGKKISGQEIETIPGVSLCSHTHFLGSAYLHVRVHADVYRDSQGLQVQPPSLWLVSGYCRKVSVD